MDWMNNDVKRYIGRRETVVATRRTDVRAALPVICAMGAFCGLVFGFVLMWGCSLAHEFAVLGGVISGALVCWGGVLHRRSVHYVLTPAGVYSIAGIVAKNVKFVPYARITDVWLRRGVAGHVFDTATIGIATASGGNIDIKTGRRMPELTLGEIPGYDDIRNYIMDRIK